MKELNAKEFYLNQLVNLWDSSFNFIKKFLYDEFLAPLSNNKKLYDTKLEIALSGKGIPDIKIPTKKELKQIDREEQWYVKLKSVYTWWALSITIFIAISIIKSSGLFFALGIFDWVTLVLFSNRKNN